MFDLVVIGAGPGGYKAALKGAKEGLKVCCVDAKASPGGTCLLEGCIPSKSLLYSSKIWKNIKNNAFAEIGVNLQEASFDFAKASEYKRSKVGILSKGIEMLFSTAKVTYVKGVASFSAVKNDCISLSIKNENGTETIECKNVLIASGSIPTELQSFPRDGQKILNSSDILNFDSYDSIPKRIGIIGGGAIGLELASVLNNIGVKATVFEYFNNIAPSMDEEVSCAMEKFLKDDGIDIKTGVKTTEFKNGKIKFNIIASGKDDEIDVDAVLVAVGRKPYTESLNLPAEIAMDEKGFIKTDFAFNTSVKGILAIGDVIGGKMLAHKAEEEGESAIDTILGKHCHKIDHYAIPAVIYTSPSAASIGFTEKELKDKGVSYKKSKVFFAANGRAVCTGMSEGFVKVLASTQNDEILGIHIIGHYADSMINEASVIYGYKGTCEDVYRISHSHPDFNETLKDSCSKIMSKL